MASCLKQKACYTHNPMARFRNRASARQDSKRRYTWKLAPFQHKTHPFPWSNLPDPTVQLALFIIKVILFHHKTHPIAPTKSPFLTTKLAPFPNQAGPFFQQT